MLAQGSHCLAWLSALAYRRDMDPLADVLDLARVHGALMATVTPPPVGARRPRKRRRLLSRGDLRNLLASRRGPAPAATRGRATYCCCRPGSPTIWSRPPTARPCRSTPTPSARASPTTASSSSVARARRPGSSAPATHYDREVAHPLLSLLPEVLHVPADPVDGARVAAIVGMLAGEVGGREPGSRAGVARLIDLLLIQVVRRWIAEGDDGRASWLRALRDPALARVLAAVHAHPDRPWTVEALAATGHLSRATLARRFVEEVGEPPLAYLTRWRMDLAARRLRESDEPIDAIARAVGYTSEYSFNRAFARHRGQPPGRYRRAAAAAVRGPVDRARLMPVPRGGPLRPEHRHAPRLVGGVRPRLVRRGRAAPPRRRGGRVPRRARAHLLQQRPAGSRPRRRRARGGDRRDGGGVRGGGDRRATPPGSTRATTGCART